MQFLNNSSGIAPVSPLHPLNVALKYTTSVQLVNKFLGMLPVNPLHPAKV